MGCSVTKERVTAPSVSTAVESSSGISSTSGQGSNNLSLITVTDEKDLFGEQSPALRKEQSRKASTQMKDSQGVKRGSLKRDSLQNVLNNGVLSISVAGQNVRQNVR